MIHDDTMPTVGVDINTITLNENSKIIAKIDLNNTVDIEEVKKCFAGKINNEDVDFIDD
jgi:hypothetical protein